MRRIRRILVAIKDADARTSPALRKAAELAQALEARLELFHALTWPIGVDSYIYTGRTFEQYQAEECSSVLKRLEKLAAHIGQGSGRRRKLSVGVAAAWDAPSYEAVIRRAVVTKADLIVADRHHGRHVAPMVLHFNDWELLRHSPMPVLLVQRSQPYRRPVVLAAVDPSRGGGKPAPLDTAILALGVSVSNALGGRLHTVHAYVPVPGGTRPTQALDAETAAAINLRIARTARRRYERALRGYPIAKSRRHLIALPARDAIEGVALDTRSDIVVMGSVSRTGWPRLWVGNTAETLLDALPCDVLVVKPPRFKLQISRKPTGARLIPSIPLVA